MTTAIQAGTTEFCKRPARCMIRCHDCNCDAPDGPFYCDKDHPNPSTWRELHPGGREIFYEGGDPEGFRQQIEAEFGIDVAGDGCQPAPDDAATPFSKHAWKRPGWTAESGWRFWCPPEHLDAIYGSDRFPLGS